MNIDFKSLWRLKQSTKKLKQESESFMGANNRTQTAEVKLVDGIVARHPASLFEVAARVIDWKRDAFIHPAASGKWEVISKKDDYTTYCMQ